MRKTSSTAPYSETGNSQTTTITTKDTRSEGGLDLGGFMVKDRVWFFAAYDRVITGTWIEPTSGAATGVDFPATYTENKYSLKLTLNLAPNTTLQGVYFFGPPVAGRDDLEEPPELQSERHSGSHRRRRTGLRRAVEPALRLERHSDAGLGASMPTGTRSSRRDRTMCR